MLIFCVDGSHGFESGMELVLARAMTGVKFCNDSSSFEVARSTFVLELLEVAVEGIGSMVSHSIWQIARLVHLNLTAVCTTFPTSPVQRHLQLIIWGLLICYAPLL